MRIGENLPISRGFRYAFMIDAAIGMQAAVALLKRLHVHHHVKGKTMKSLRKIFAFAIAASFVSLSASFASADPYRHICSSAQKIQRKSNLLVQELRRYRHTPEYPYLVEDALTLRRLAAHVHQVARRSGDVFHLAADLRQLDRTFHHTARTFDRVERDAAFGRGHIHGNTCQVTVLLNAIDACIHRMQADVRTLKRIAIRQQHIERIVVPPQRVIISRPVYGGVGSCPLNRGSYGGYYGRTQGGISIQRGGFNFNIGF